jgi:hypothetical protein
MMETTMEAMWGFMALAGVLGFFYSGLGVLVGRRFVFPSRPLAFLGLVVSFGLFVFGGSQLPQTKAVETAGQARAEAEATPKTPVAPPQVKAIAASEIIEAYMRVPDHSERRF